MQIIMRRHNLKSDKRGISSIVVVALSFMIIVAIVANVILWSYQMNQLDWEKMKENVAIENVIEGSSTVYTPSGYTLLGSTQLASGSVGDLVSNNGVYMTFRSYASVTGKTDAFVAYRDSTTSLNTPKERTWTGDTATWGSQNSMSTAGSPVRFVRVAYCPISQRSFEKIVVTLSDDGYLDAYVWDGSTWQVTNNIGSVGITVNAYRAFDVQYEKTSGKGMLVYSMGGGAVDMQYKTWNGTAWSSANNLDLTGTASGTVVYWISLAQKPTSGANEIALICSEVTTSYAYAKIWNGASWGNEKKSTSALGAPQRETFAIAYEQSSGHAEAIISATKTSEWSVEWNGATWGSDIATDFGGNTEVMWMTAKADPASDKIVVAVVDASIRLDTQYWSGSAWDASPTTQDSSVDTSSTRCGDFAWEPIGSKGLLVWGTTAGRIAYKTFTAPNTWGTQQNPLMGANTHPWVQLRTNPISIAGDAKILGAVLEDTVFDLGAVEWDGTTFNVIGTNTISSDTTVATYECFEIEFKGFGTSNEFTSEVEFTGTSNTESWDQLTWTIDNAWTTSNVSVKLQLYDYNLGAYPTSGNGYISYTSSATPNTDETKSQTISVNPTHFRDTSGNWRMKIKGVRSTSTAFDSKVDWIEFRLPASESKFILRNKGASTSHIVSLWVINSTYHQHYSVDIFLNSGNTLSYTRMDIRLLSGQYLVKIVTEKGNTAIYSKD